MKTFIIVILSAIACVLGGNLDVAMGAVLLPDLVPMSAGAVSNNVTFVTPSPQNWPTVPIAYSVTNQGTGAASGFWIDFVAVSTNGSTSGIVSSDYSYQYWYNPTLPAGGIYTVTNFVSVPPLSGTYWPVIEVNLGNNVSESATTNNTLIASTPFTLAYQLVPPDLAPVSVVVASNQVAFYPPSPQAPTIPVTAIVTNQGMGAAIGYWYDTISVSTNGTTNGIITSQYFSQNGYGPGVPAGGSYNETDNVSLPEQGGTYWLIFQANTPGYLYEDDTTNNMMVVSMPVTVSYGVVPPDLTPLSVAAATNLVAFYPPSPQPPGVQVTYIVTNEGIGAALGWWYDTISVSTNGSANGIISSQVFWQYKFSPGVSAGETYTETDYVPLPEQSGNYWIIFQANAPGYLLEGDTNNNSMVSAVPITVSYQVVPPDLAPVSIKAAVNQVVFNPPSPQQPNIAVTCMVTNEGLGEAIGSWYDTISVSTNGKVSGIVSSQDFWQYQYSPDVPSGGTYTETDIVSLPEQSGKYWLIFQANTYDELYEGNASNNTLVDSVLVTVSYQVIPPDLAPVSVVAATNRVVFDPPNPQSPSVPVICVLTNKGRGAVVGYWNDMISVSTDGTINGIISSQSFAQYLDAPGLLSGRVYRETNTVLLPQQNGKYWLIFQANADGYLYEPDATNNTKVSLPLTVSYQVVSPDLAPLSVTAASNHIDFDPPSSRLPTISVACLVTNEGLGVASGSWFDTISISTNGNVSGIIAAQSFLQYWNPGLTFGETYRETNEITLPGQSGTYWLIFQANTDGYLYEDDTTNNMLVATTPVTLSYQVVPPDLAPLSVNFTSNNVAFDPTSPQTATVPVVCLVTNEGLGAAAGFWYDTISLSTNGAPSGIISSQEVYYESDPVLAGESYQITNTVWLPQRSGTYWVVFQANPGGYLYETDTTNNTMIAPTPVTLSYQIIPPDLAPVSVTAASNHVDFDPASPQTPTVPVTCLVTNEGLGAAMGYWYDEISVSTNGNLSGTINSQWFGQSPDSPGVAVGAAYRETNSVSLPERSGTYWLIFQVNPFGSLYETDATNNTMVASGPVTVSYQVVSPDLAPVSVAVATNHVAFYPPSPQAPTVTVTCVVTNEGQGSALGFWYDSVSVSTNGTASGIIASQTFEESENFPGLPWGGTYDETNVVALPQQSGTYWLIFQANAYGYLYEDNTTNNTMVASGPVTVTYQVVPPDLTAVSVMAVSNHLAFNPSSPQAPSIPVAWVVRNNGTGLAAGYWNDVISISTNGTMSGIINSQYFGQSPDSPGVAVGAAYRETNSMSLPERSATYWLILSANEDGSLYETNLANNVLIGSVPFTVRYKVVPPDLVPLSIAAASNHVAFSTSSPQSQPRVPVICAVMNQGAGMAQGYWYDTISVSTNGTTNGIISSQDFLVDWSSPLLPSKGIYQDTNYVTLPGQSGTYWLILQANHYNYLYEANANNNTLMAIMPVTVTSQLIPPDLAPATVMAMTNNLVFYPSSPWALPAVSVVYTVTNLGPGSAAGDWNDLLWVSTNSTGDDMADYAYFNEFWWSPGLSSGGTYQRTNTVTLPAQNGTYWVSLQVNAYNELYEGVTTNNTMTAPVLVTVTVNPVMPPDLAPVKLMPSTDSVDFYPSSLYPPNQWNLPTIQVVYAVTNEGTGPALGSWYDTVFVSTTSTADGAVWQQVFHESWDTSGLLPGAVYQRTNTVTLPSQTGTYWLIFQANNYNWLYEADTTNNTITASVPISLTVHPATAADLAPVNLAALSTNLIFHSPSPQNLPIVQVVYAVTNAGLSAVGGLWTDTISVSTNASMSGIISSQNFSESWRLANLPADGTYQRTNYVFLPARSGRYWLILQANAYNNIYEVDTTNNTLIDPAPVTLTYAIQPPDLAPASVVPLATRLSFHPSLPESPEVAVRCLVTNKGAGTASGPWYDCVYVSTDRTTNGAVSLQLFEHADPVPPHGLYQETNYVWLPQRSGNYWLIFQANNGALLYEQTMTNNTLAASSPVTLAYSLMTSPVSRIPAAPNLAVNHAGSSLVPSPGISAVRLSATSVQLQVSGMPAHQYILLSGTDLAANATWVPIATNTAAGDGNWFFTVTNNFTQPAHFYRAMVQSP